MIYDKQEELYHKYLAFHDVLLEEYDPMEIAAIMVVQGLSIYKTVLSEEDYQKMVDSIYMQKDDVIPLNIDGPDIDLE